MYFTKYCLLVYLMVASTRLQAQIINPAIERIENNILKLDKAGKEKGKPQTLLARMKDLGVPGISIAVFDNGQIQWAKGYGVTDKSSTEPIDTTTLFQAASVSKPLTTVALMKLAEENKIQLDEDINLQLTSWQLPANDFTNETKVTPRLIAGHMGGLSVQGFVGYKQTDKIPGLVEILNGVAPANSKPVRAVIKPGVKQQYSGGGFTVLQLLLEEKTKQSFSSLMKEMVLQPAGMNRSLFAVRLPDSLQTRFAKSNGNAANGGYNVYPEQAAAGLWTTPSDLATFMINVGNSYREGKGILQQKTVQGMFAKQPGGNGTGFGMEGEGDGQRFGHWGGNVGYACYAFSFVNNGRGVVVMTNSDNGFQLIKEVVRAVMKEYGWK